MLLTATTLSHGRDLEYEAPDTFLPVQNALGRLVRLIPEHQLFDLRILLQCSPVWEYALDELGAD